jgi:2-oxoglutarate dehydrogenase E2 component (dihydrolipoamide succinyltransferase)
MFDFINKYWIMFSNMVDFRKKYTDQFIKRHNMKLGFMSAFVKASACALVDNPIVNAGKYD